MNADKTAKFESEGCPCPPIAAIVDQLTGLLAQLRVGETTGPPSPPPSSDVGLGDKGWLTMKEAITWTGLGRKFLSGKMAEGRLWFQRFGGRGDIRIPKAHLDEQMARCFPLLDVPLTLADLERMPVRPLTRLIPGPKIERDPNKPFPRLK